MNWNLTKTLLPEKEGAYLVTRESCDEVSVMNFDTNENIFYRFGYDREGFPEVDYADDVIAWLPFPKPYKKEKGEQPMFTIYGNTVILVVEHLTIEQVGTFMAHNRDKIGTVTLVNETTGERSVY